MPSSLLRARAPLVVLTLLASLPSCLLADPPVLKPFQQDIPTAALKIEMLPIPAASSGPDTNIRPFWMSKTEITWDVFDIYAYRLDETPDKPLSDAQLASRPTKPYLPPDRGLGHEGFAAISITHKSAAKFCEWLSEKSGKRFRLPTESEWEHAAWAGAKHDPAAKFPFPESDFPDYAWFKANADGTPHPVGKKKPSPLGLCDMLGNVREWVTGADGKPTTKGGCYLDVPADLAISAHADQQKSWNQTDPQIPKSTWWLSDSPFAGFRILCEAEPGTDQPAKPLPSAAKPDDRPGDKPPPPAPPIKDDKK